MVRTAGVMLVAGLLLGAAACGGGSGPPTASGSPTSPRPSSPAKLAIVSPKNGSIVHGSTVDVRLSLQGARIVQTTSLDVRPDQGHVHLYLDGALISMNYSLDDQIPNVPPGHHLLQAEFVASDHAPFDPRVIAVSSFEVKG